MTKVSLKTDNKQKPKKDFLEVQNSLFVHYGKGYSQFGTLVREESDKIIVKDPIEEVCREIAKETARIVEKPSACDLYEILTWDFETFRQLHCRYQISLDLNTEPLINNEGKTLEGFSFFDPVIRSYHYFCDEFLEKALYLLDVGASINAEAWTLLLKGYNEIYDTHGGDSWWKKKARKNIKKNQEFINKLFIDLIKKGGIDPMMVINRDLQWWEKESDKKEEYSLIRAIKKSKNKALEKEISKISTAFSDACDNYSLLS